MDSRRIRLLPKPQTTPRATTPKPPTPQAPLNPLANSNAQQRSFLAEKISAGTGVIGIGLTTVQIGQDAQLDRYQQVQAAADAAAASRVVAPAAPAAEPPATALVDPAVAPANPAAAVPADTPADPAAAGRRRRAAPNTSFQREQDIYYRDCTKIYSGRQRIQHCSPDIVAAAAPCSV